MEKFLDEQSVGLKSKTKGLQVKQAPSLIICELVWFICLRDIKENTTKISTKTQPQKSRLRIPQVGSDK